MTDYFRLFDKDGNGFVDAEEFLVAMTTLGEKMTLKEVQGTMWECDANRDGQINYDEFVNMMLLNM